MTTGTTTRARLIWPWLVLLLLLGGATTAVAGTLLHVGAERADEPVGVSLRDESVRRGGGFFLFYGRTHRGGGLAGGK